MAVTLHSLSMLCQVPLLVLHSSLSSRLCVQVRKLFGVKSSLFGVLPGRVTYVIDKSGVIKHSFNSQLQFAKHSKEALDAVKSLA